MKKYFYFILLIIISSSCTEQAKWFTTKEDLGAWNIINNGSTYSWQGGNLGSLVHGKGELIEYNKSGKIVSRNTYNAKCGILTEDNKKQTPVGTFYGEEVKNAMPHSLGLLIIGFIIGLCIPLLLPYIGIIDICLTILALVMGLYVAFFYETPIILDLEAEISRMIIDNYLYYIDAQNIIPQIVG